MMEYIVQWATILSPIIAVALAWWAVRSSTKDTDRKIAALEESTTKQIESIKKLAKTQIELEYIQIQKDISEARTSFLQVSKRASDELERDEHSNRIGGEYEIIRQRQDRRRDLSDQIDFIAKNLQNLQVAQNKLNALKKEEGE